MKSSIDWITLAHYFQPIAFRSLQKDHQPLYSLFWPIISIWFHSFCSMQSHILSIFSMKISCQIFSMISFISLMRASPFLFGSLLFSKPVLNHGMMVFFMFQISWEVVLIFCHLDSSDRNLWSFSEVPFLRHYQTYLKNCLLAFIIPLIFIGDNYYIYGKCSLCSFYYQ